MIEPYYDAHGIRVYRGNCHDVVPQLFSSGVLDHCHTVVLTSPPFEDGTLGRKGTNIPSTSKRPIDPTWLMTLGRRQIINSATRFSIGIPPRGRLLIWDKRDGYTVRYGDAEAAWDSGDGAMRVFHYRQTVTCYGDVVRRAHPGQRPLALMLWWAKQAKVESNDTILDPYVGSGTSLVAALALGVKAIGVELNPSWCEFIAQRVDNAAAMDPSVLMAVEQDPET